MPLSFMTDSVTIIRAPFRVKNGMEYRVWTTDAISTTEAIGPIEKTIMNVQVTAQSTSRDFDGRVEQVTDRRTLRAPFNADIQPGDRVIWNGDTYEIDGDVYHTKSPTGRVSSTRCTLVRWEG